jgi:hypothetical protein
MTTRTRTASGTRTPVQQAALLVGSVFLLVGILGSVPGVTTDLDTTKFASHDFVPLNTADDWLHFFLGAGMIALGVLLSRSRTTRR